MADAAQLDLKLLTFEFLLFGIGPPPPPEAAEAFQGSHQKEMAAPISRRWLTAFLRIVVNARGCHFLIVKQRCFLPRFPSSGCVLNQHRKRPVSIRRCCPSNSAPRCQRLQCHPKSSGSGSGSGSSISISTASSIASWKASLNSDELRSLAPSFSIRSPASRMIAARMSSGANG